jgi:hypothetical protein
VNKRWIQYGLVAMAVAATGIGISQVKHHSSPNDAWVTAVSQRSVTNDHVSSANDAQVLKVPVTSGGHPTGNAQPTTGSAPRATSSGGTGQSNGSSNTRTNTKTNTSGALPTNSTGTVTTKPGTPTQPDLGSFTITVSEDKGQTVVSKKSVEIVKGESLMQYMHQSYDITTAYGDDFMVSINGIKSQWTDVAPAQRQPVDWFSYINGTQAPVGAGDIVPRAGDVDTWDYHRWDPSTGKG